MAHRESLKNPEFVRSFGGKNVYWNVSSNVGYGCRNNNFDVKLVQFFLNRIAAKFPGTKPLVEDGKFGGNTWAAIKRFQTDVSFECVVDGTVSSPPYGRTITPKHGMIYTIILLNFQYNFHYPQNNLDILKDPFLPGDLKFHLSGPLPNLL